MKTFIIAEKPSVASDIADALGGCSRRDGFYESDTVIVGAARGHLLKLALPPGTRRAYELSDLPVVPERFHLEPIDEGCAELLARLALTARRSDVLTIVNACDAGREGEAIFRNLYSALGVSKPVRRMWLQSMTSTAIEAAWGALRSGSEYDGLGDAAQCRAEADWIVGINASRALCKLAEMQTGARELFTAGRVQTPTLALIVNRELAIKRFVPQSYWRVNATFAAEAGEYSAQWVRSVGEDRGVLATQDDSKRPLDAFATEEEANAVAAAVDGASASSVEDDASEERRNAPKLFDLTTLQREANKRFGYSAAVTLGIAQVLYEKRKVTTYPRTDSSYLPTDYVDTARATMEALSRHETAEAKNAKHALDHGLVRYVKTVFDDAKISDHFAIIPTGLTTLLEEQESNVYGLIVKRFIAAFYPPAIFNRTTRVTTVADHTFVTRGRVLAEAGWLGIYGKEDDDSNAAALVRVEGGELPLLRSCSAAQGATKAPPRYTDATLLLAMETAGKTVEDEALADAMKERGLGTPATRASIIEALLQPDRGYVTRSGTQLVPSAKGVGVVHFLRTNAVEELTGAALTGDWEFKLHEVEQGTRRRSEYMRDIEAFTRGFIQKIRATAPAESKVQASLRAPCPMCGASMVTRSKSYSCSEESKCGFVLWKQIGGRVLSMSETEQLLSTRNLPVTGGFVSKQGRAFAAGLMVSDEGKAEFVFADATTSVQK